MLLPLGNQPEHAIRRGDVHPIGVGGNILLHNSSCIGDEFIVPDEKQPVDNRQEASANKEETLLPQTTAGQRTSVAIACPEDARGCPDQ